MTVIVVPSLPNAVANQVDQVQSCKPVFNLAVWLRDSWGK